MKSLLSVYKNVGKSVQGAMTRKESFLLHGAEPCISQTPGRLQYYRAENEPFIPGKLENI
jgi:hypothetical protein